MKNKIFLGLILGIFLIGIVSASITGYLVTRGGGIAEAGTTATLQGVRDGVATIAVTTQAGDTQVVRVREGETTKVGEATISADNLRSGNLFRRGGANIALNISNISAAQAPIKVPGAIVFPSPTCNGVYDDTLNTNTFRYWAKKNNLDYHEYISVTSNSGQHYFLDFRPREDIGNNINETDVYNLVTGQYGATDKIAGDAVTIGNIQITIVEVYVNATDKYVDLEINGGYFSDSCTEAVGGAHTHLSDYQYKTVNLVKNAQTTPTYNVFAREIDCTKFGKGYIVLGGGYELSPKVPAGYIVEINGPTSKTVYSVELRDYNIQFQNLTGNVFATCARIEPTLHQFGQDY